jgi:hypothetical protein
MGVTQQRHGTRVLVPTLDSDTLQPIRNISQGYLPITEQTPSNLSKYVAYFGHRDKIIVLLTLLHPCKSRKYQTVPEGDEFPL